MNALALTFNDVQFDVVDRNGQPWDMPILIRFKRFMIVTKMSSPTA